MLFLYTSLSLIGVHLIYTTMEYIVLVMNFYFYHIFGLFNLHLLSFLIY